MIASRFQGRFGYGPGLRVGQFGDAQQNSIPSLPDVPQGPIAPQQPAPQPEAPVYAGAQPQREDGGNTPGDLGAPFGEPVPLGSLGLGAGNYGMLGSALGGLAGLAAGVPGLGLAAGALGTYADQQAFNTSLANRNFNGRVEFGPALASNLTFGLAGRSAADQFNDAFQAGNLGVLSEFASGLNLGPSAMPAGFTDTVEPDQTFSFDNVSYSGGGADPGASTGGAGYSDSSADGGYGGENQFMHGGYTGAGKDGQVQPHAEAGTVHEGEVVIPAAQVARYGLPALMMIARGDLPAARLAALARGV
jgi:hypothetical protein